MGRKKKARRTKTAHPGVKLKQVSHRSGATSWVARWRDPDSGGEKQQSLDALGRTTAEARREWAIRRSKTLQERRAGIAAGEEPRAETPLREAVELYYTGAGARLKPNTINSYRGASDLFLTWAKGARIRLAEDLRGPHLATYRNWLAARAKRRPTKNGSRGERATTGKLLSPATVNNRLRPLKTLLRELGRLGLTPNLSRDQVQDGLRPLRPPKTHPKFLKARDLLKLLRAVERHDADCFAETRDEHGGKGEPGATPKFEPIGPFLSMVLLTGMRFDEARTLRAEQVDLEAAPAGEVVVKAPKTGMVRTVDLTVSPSLRKLLAGLLLRTEGKPSLFGGSKPLPRTHIEAARRRLVNSYGAPAFTWLLLRHTCGTFLTNAPGIFGAASAYRSAKQLGHSVTVAEKHYVGVIRGLPPKAHDLDSAMGIAKELGKVVARLEGGGRKRQRKGRRRVG